MTFDGATVRPYRNGNLLGSAPMKRTFVPSGKPLYLGTNKNGTTNQPFEGMLDDIVIFAGALPPQAIAAAGGRRTARSALTPLSGGRAQHVGGRANRSSGFVGNMAREQTAPGSQRSQMLPIEIPAPGMTYEPQWRLHGHGELQPQA
jgi:hypothetical protein